MREEFGEWGLPTCADSLSVTLDPYVVTGLCVPRNGWEVAGATQLSQKTVAS